MQRTSFCCFRTSVALAYVRVHGFRCAGTKPEAAQAAKDATKQAVEGRDRRESELPLKLKCHAARCGGCQNDSHHTDNANRRRPVHLGFY